MVFNGMVYNSYIFPLQSSTVDVAFTETIEYRVPESLRKSVLKGSIDLSNQGGSGKPIEPSI